MGGKALNKVETRRLNKREFNIISDDIEKKIKNIFKDTLISTIKSYERKDTFGDVDILLSKEKIVDFIEKNKVFIGKHQFTNPLLPLIEDLFNSRQQVVALNGNSLVSLSFDYRFNKDDNYGYQVDFIFCEQSDFEFNKNYLAYNDLGNLMGKTAPLLGFKLTHNGLWYYMKDGEDEFARIMVTNNFKETINFLGFNFSEYNKGFKDTDSIFDFIMKGKYFNDNCYYLNNLPAKTRAKELKRGTYMKFLDYLKNKNIDNYDIEAPLFKEKMLNEAFVLFPEFKINYDRANAYRDKIKKTKDLLNGHKIKQWTNIEANKISLLLGKVKSQFKDQFEFYDWLDTNTEDNIKKFVISISEKYTLSENIGIIKFKAEKMILR